MSSPASNDAKQKASSPPAAERSADDVAAVAPPPASRPPTAASQPDASGGGPSASSPVKRRRQVMSSDAMRPRVMLPALRPRRRPRLRKSWSTAEFPPPSSCSSSTARSELQHHDRTLQSIFKPTPHSLTRPPGRTTSSRSARGRTCLCLRPRASSGAAGPLKRHKSTAPAACASSRSVGGRGRQEGGLMVGTPTVTSSGEVDGSIRDEPSAAEPSLLGSRCAS